MKVYIDTDPYIYQIASVLQPVCYWAEGNSDYFETKREAIAYCKEHEIPVDTIEKENFLMPPWYIKTFTNSTLNHVVPGIKREAKETVKLPIKEVEWVLSSKENFRRDLDLTYKAQRPSKPRWHKEVRKYIKDKTSAWSFPGLEADDVIAYLHWDSYHNEGPYSSMIAAIDKDFDILPGWHYHLRDKYCYWVTEDEAEFNLKKQLITGDTSDNIPGIKGMGEKKAAKFIEENPTESWAEFRELLITECYSKQFDFPEDRYDTNFKLLDIGGVYSEMLGNTLHTWLQDLRQL